LHEELEAALCVSIPSWYGLGLASFKANAVNEVVAERDCLKGRRKRRRGYSKQNALRKEKEGLSITNAVEEEGGNFCEERLVCAGIRCRAGY
jgi:hypothetical protein